MFITVNNDQYYNPNESLGGFILLNVIFIMCHTDIKKRSDNCNENYNKETTIACRSCAKVFANWPGQEWMNTSSNS